MVCLRNICINTLHKGDNDDDDDDDDDNNNNNNNNNNVPQTSVSRKVVNGLQVAENLKTICLWQQSIIVKYSLQINSYNRAKI